MKATGERLLQEGSAGVAQIARSVPPNVTAFPWTARAGEAAEAVFRNASKALHVARAKFLQATQLNGQLGATLKRTIDVIASGAALVLLFPVFVIIAIAIRRSMGKGVVYAHPRVGQGGKVFDCYKFRSMVSDSATVLEHHLDESPSARLEWNATRKLRHDPRVTPLGRLLRRTSLDELPQLLNVLKGDMSLVGPRPIVTSELELYKPYTAEYTAVRPGMTGLWQVSGRSNTSYARRVELDRFYARRGSVGLDLSIIMRTIPAIIRTNETA